MDKIRQNRFADPETLDVIRAEMARYEHATRVWRGLAAWWSPRNDQERQTLHRVGRRYHPEPPALTAHGILAWGLPLDLDETAQLFVKECKKGVAQGDETFVRQLFGVTNLLHVPYEVRQHAERAFRRAVELKLVETAPYTYESRITKYLIPTAKTRAEAEAQAAKIRDAARKKRIAEACERARIAKVTSLLRALGFLLAPRKDRHGNPEAPVEVHGKELTVTLRMADVCAVFGEGCDEVVADDVVREIGRELAPRINRQGWKAVSLAIEADVLEYLRGKDLDAAARMALVQVALDAANNAYQEARMENAEKEETHV